MANDAINSPPSILVLGMAGSGKTTFVNVLDKYLKKVGKHTTVVNLDPAVYKVPYQADIDIRDTINYKNVMKEYSLGPNGAILSSLNLYTTKMDQFYEKLASLSKEKNYTIIDTPGQIEVFTWSASGTIICESLARTSPTIIVFIVDSVKAKDPCTFMSNMLYAVSCMYRSRLPLMVVFNKIDLIENFNFTKWMTDFDSVYEAISKESSYLASLSCSMNLAIEPFYSNLNHESVSCIQEDSGFDKILIAIDKSVEEFRSEFATLFNNNSPTVGTKEKLKNGKGEEVQLFLNLTDN